MWTLINPLFTYLVLGLGLRAEALIVMHFAISPYLTSLLIYEMLQDVIVDWGWKQIYKFPTRHLFVRGEEKVFYGIYGGSIFWFEQQGRYDWKLDDKDCQKADVDRSFVIDISPIAMFKEILCVLQP